MREDGHTETEQTEAERTNPADTSRANRGVPADFPAPRPVRALPEETARKIAAGEVIDRPAAAVRELMDNAIDSGASQISVEIENGGISRIRVGDDGCGMSEADLALCVQNHTTSKISSVDDLLKISTLGFRGEALASIHAVSRLEITSARDGRAYKLIPGGTVLPAVRNKGTLVQADGLFENFPARRQFLKRASAESALCRQVFTDKALAWHGIGFKLTVDGTVRLLLPPAQSFKERCLDALKSGENPSFFYEIQGSGRDFSFSAVLGSPDVPCKDRRSEYVFVNGRRINDFGLQQAVEFGAQGCFPNGLHPFFCLFLSVNPECADFNIHPAKREVRFKDQPAIHHAVSSVCKDFYRRYMMRGAANTAYADSAETERTASLALGFPEAPATGAAEANPSYGRYGQFSAPPIFRPQAPQSPQIPQNRGAPHTPHGGDAAHRGYAGWTGQSHTDISGARTNISGARDAPAEPAASGVSATTDSEIRGGVLQADSGRTYPDIPTDFRFLGQVLGTFLAVEKDGKLLLIDQHAAHERILYNELLARRGERQELLVPYRIDSPDARTDKCLKEKAEELSEAGFTLKSGGDGFWLVTTVPPRWTGTEKELREKLTEGAASPETLISGLYATEACRAACKDSDILDPATARNLAAKALALPEPFCPHGRPVYTEITREELFRRVKRT